MFFIFDSCDSIVFERGNRAGQPVIDGIPALIIWAIGLVIVGHFVLTRTRFGNWIFASGGDAQAARYVGVPDNRVLLMFMFSAFYACLCGGGAGVRIWSWIPRAVERIRGNHCSGNRGRTLPAGTAASLAQRSALSYLAWSSRACFLRVLKAPCSGSFLGVRLSAAVILNTYIRRIITGKNRYGSVIPVAKRWRNTSAP